jgi:hypothetical protein
MRLGRFFVAIWADWLARMSGPLTVPLTVAAFFVSAKVYKGLFAGLAVISALLTCYRVWSKEHTQADELRKKLDDRKPHLVLAIEGVLWQYSPVEDVTVFILSAYLLNKGEPTVAMNWRAKYLIGGGGEDMKGFYLCDSYTITIGNEQLTLTNDNLLYAQVLTHRLERGEGKIGRLVFSVPGNRLGQIASNQYSITLSCSDFEGTQCVASFKPSGVPLDGIRVVPGEQLRKASADTPTSKYLTQ